MSYFDSAATTPIHPDVLEAMMPYLKDDYGNAGSIHKKGRRAMSAISNAREQVASLIGCNAEQIIFTSGGSEANNIAIAGLKNYLLSTQKTHIIASRIEHDSVLRTIESLCKSNGGSPFEMSLLEVQRNGCVTISDFINTIKGRTGLVSVMHTNNEIGSINPVSDIGEICKLNGILFHTDCVQAIGTEKINVDDIGCDLMSISGHKINAPKGIGALFVRDMKLLNPIIYGGMSQEFGYRGGTENVPAIVGMGVACDLLRKNMESDTKYISGLKAEFEKALIEYSERLCIKDKFHINSPPDSRKIVNIRFDGVDGQTLLLMLDGDGVYVSAGSACRSLESHPSHVLTAIGLSESDARSSIRISLSKLNTEDEVRDAALNIMTNASILINGVK